MPRPAVLLLASTLALSALADIDPGEIPLPPIVTKMGRLECTPLKSISP
jgi:hypothetical protein